MESSRLPKRKAKCVPTQSGGSECLAAFPALAANFDPQRVGYAVLDGDGRVTVSCGLARTKPADDPVWAAIAHSARGRGHAEALDGVHRLWATAGQEGRVEVLVTDAGAEVECAERLDHLQRHTAALDRLGKVLTRNQSSQALAMGTVHALFASLDLAAALLWTLDDDGQLKLAETVGVGRGMLHGLHEPELGVSATTAVGLVATSRKPLLVPRLTANPLTAAHEAGFVTDDSSAIVMPLVSAGRFVGVLELIARIEDDRFLRRHDMWLSLAEHVAMGIHSAILFEQTERMASQDPLTGIANHRAMQDYLALRLTEAKRERRPLGVVMVDVDHFRRFNEEEGHDAGDRVLQAVASCLASSLRGYDMAARYGGEEFTLILPGDDLQAAVAAAERARQAIMDLDTGYAKVTASFGCAAYPVSGIDPSSLLKVADLALYEAKRAGRNRVETARVDQRHAC
ncbi:MAG: diguanylate cyclase [Armatimonadetes bacterium]|nr:diguanylate cyclase [Armatimonadota bacterium]